ncbi:MAG: hypothetical protein ABTB30_03810, partial [Clostridia bacterium]
SYLFIILSPPHGLLALLTAAQGCVPIRDYSRTVVDLQGEQTAFAHENRRFVFLVFSRFFAHKILCRKQTVACINGNSSVYFPGVSVSE